MNTPQLDADLMIITTDASWISLPALGGAAEARGRQSWTDLWTFSLEEAEHYKPHKSLSYSTVRLRLGHAQVDDGGSGNCLSLPCKGLKVSWSRAVSWW